jgi:hypothetical protein
MCVRLIDARARPNGFSAAEAARPPALAKVSIFDV